MPIIWDFHAFGGPSSGGRSTTSNDCWLRGKLTSSDKVAELLGNWDLVKEWPYSHHCNARNGHGVELEKTKVRTLTVVVLKGGNRFCNDLRLRVTRGEGLLNDKKDHGVEVNKRHIRSGSTTIPTNGKRNVVSRAKDRADLVETCNLKNTFCQVMDGTFLPNICTRCQVKIGKKAIGLLGETTAVGSAEERRLESR